MVICAAALIILIALGAYYGGSPDTRGINEDRVLSLESRIDTTIPGVRDDLFIDRVTSYCRSEQSIDNVQTMFTVEDRTMSRNAATTLKGLLDREEVCL